MVAYELHCRRCGINWIVANDFVAEKVCIDKGCGSSNVVHNELTNKEQAIELIFTKKIKDLEIRIDNLADHIDELEEVVETEDEDLH